MPVPYPLPHAYRACRIGPSRSVLAVSPRPGLRRNNKRRAVRNTQDRPRRLTKAPLRLGRQAVPRGAWNHHDRIPRGITARRHWPPVVGVRAPAYAVCGGQSPTYAQPVAEHSRIVPAHVFHWKVPPVHAWEKPGPLEAAGVRPHHVVPLPLRHGVPAHVEADYRNVACWPFAGPTVGGTHRAAHLESPALDTNKIGVLAMRRLRPCGNRREKRRKRQRQENSPQRHASPFFRWPIMAGSQ